MTNTERREIAQAGNFRGLITEYGLVQQQSGATAIWISARIDEAWDPENKEWVDCREYNIFATGDIYIIKKDGKINQSQAEALAKYAGWDMNLASVYGNSWVPTPSQFVVNSDTYKDKTRYRIEWVNAYDRTPGQRAGVVDLETAKVIEAQYGSQFRALAGNVKRNGDKPTGKPSAPKPAQAPREDVAKAPSIKPEEGEKEIPF